MVSIIKHIFLGILWLVAHVIAGVAFAVGVKLLCGMSKRIQRGKETAS